MKRLDRRKDEMNIHTATETELRDSKVPTFEDVKELGGYITSLVERDHDYGTCVYAMSLAATAAFNYVARKLGVTGFQASCADLDILARTRNWKWGKLLDYEKLLYPQYCTEEYYPSWEEIIRQNKEEFARRTKELLENADEYIAERVLRHWHLLASQKSARPLT